MGRPKKLFRTSQKGAERVTIPGAIHLVFFLRGLCVAGQSCLLVATLIGRGTLNFGGSSLASGSGSQRRRGDVSSPLLYLFEVTLVQNGRSFKSGGLGSISSK